MQVACDIHSRGIGHHILDFCVQEHITVGGERKISDDCQVP